MSEGGEDPPTAPTEETAPATTEEAPPAGEEAHGEPTPPGAEEHVPASEDASAPAEGAHPSGGEEASAAGEGDDHHGEDQGDEHHADEHPSEEGGAPGEGDEHHEEGKEGEEDKGAEKSVSVEKTASLQKADSKTAPHTKSSLEMIQEQKSSKMSVSSLSKKQSGEDSKEGFVRRKSTRSIQKAVGSIVSFRRGSIAEYFDRQKTAKFANSYKLDSDNPFNAEKVEKILEEVLVEALENLTYDTDKIPKQAKWASSAIRAKVKEQEYDRYKIICLVTIGEKRSQDMFFAYRFLWDLDRDRHASFWHENMYVFAIACCFGLYYE